MDNESPQLLFFLYTIVKEEEKVPVNMAPKNKLMHVLHASETVNTYLL